MASLKYRIAHGQSYRHVKRPCGRSVGDFSRLAKVERALALYPQSGHLIKNRVAILERVDAEAADFSLFQEGLHDPTLFPEYHDEWEWRASDLLTKNATRWIWREIAVEGATYQFEHGYLSEISLPIVPNAARLSLVRNLLSQIPTLQFIHFNAQNRTTERTVILEALREAKPREGKIRIRRDTPLEIRVITPLSFLTAGPGNFQPYFVGLVDYAKENLGGVFSIYLQPELETIASSKKIPQHMTNVPMLHFALYANDGTFIDVFSTSDSPTNVMMIPRDLIPEEGFIKFVGG